MKKATVIQERISDLRRQVEVTEADRDVKMQNQDHHGVRDACVDIETKQAAIQQLLWVLG